MNVGGPGNSPRSSHKSRDQPNALDELPPRRERLLKSGNEAVRILVQKVADLQTQLETYQLTPDEHKALCHVVMEAAAMLNGSSEVDEGVLKRVGVADLDSTQRYIPQAVYVGIADDLKLQLDEVRGVVAKRPPNPNPNPNPEPEPHPFPSPLLGEPWDDYPAMVPRRSVNEEALDGILPAISSAFLNLDTSLPDGLFPRQRARADASTMNEASQAVAGGASAREVIQRFGLFNAEDFQQIHDLARDFARIRMSDRMD